MSSHDDELPRLAHVDDYERYGRQMILEPFGLQGQIKLQDASVLVVGAGGLGCPALQYLAAAGVGKLTIIDHDVVDLSNLQRQVLHTEQRVGTNKAESAATALRQLNSRVTVTPIPEALTTSNAPHLLSIHDLALDCSDNAPTRYLLSDSAASTRTPLVSGAAQSLEGQITTYCFGESGPCHRCLFPRPPAPEYAKSCAETGILGAVAGVIGTLQATEAIKILSGMADNGEYKPTMMLYSMLAPTPFRTIKLRSRRKDCAACGTDPSQAKNPINEIDYVQFCGGPRPDWLKLGMEGSEEARVRPKELQSELQDGNAEERPCVLDVRPQAEFGICRLPGSIHVPLRELVSSPDARAHLPVDLTGRRIVVVCRLGNDSQIGAAALREAGLDARDLRGGLRAWSGEVDPTFPVY
ncbi:hypothetical protein PENSPDRAFT_679416 [Peniophora sp. CONT]|nr:hypothetical protein PENSPDRAFT_679416 [Peniophora sp. CONT]